MSSSSLKAFIFDLDGVIVDTARYHFLAWKRLADELDIAFTEHDNEMLKGVSRMQSLETLLSLGGAHKSEGEKEELATRKNAWFVDSISRMEPGEVFPGVMALLASLKTAGYKIGLASSSRNAPQVIRALGIASAFDTIVDGSMVVHAKPDPEIFLLTAERLQVDPSACVVFEDAASGVEAAHRAGMKCVGIGEEEQLGAAEWVIPRTADFTLTTLNKL